MIKIIILLYILFKITIVNCIGQYKEKYVVEPLGEDMLQSFQVEFLQNNKDSINKIVPLDLQKIFSKYDINKLDIIMGSGIWESFWGNNQNFFSKTEWYPKQIPLSRGIELHFEFISTDTIDKAINTFNTFFNTLSSFFSLSVNLYSTDGGFSIIERCNDNINYNDSNDKIKYCGIIIIPYKILCIDNLQWQLKSLPCNNIQGQRTYITNWDIYFNSKFRSLYIHYKKDSSLIYNIIFIHNNTINTIDKKVMPLLYMSPKNNTIIPTCPKAYETLSILIIPNWLVSSIYSSISDIDDVLKDEYKLNKYLEHEYRNKEKNKSSLWVKISNGTQLIGYNEYNNDLNKNIEEKKIQPIKIYTKVKNLSTDTNAFYLNIDKTTLLKVLNNNNNSVIKVYKYTTSTSFYRGIIHLNININSTILSSSQYNNITSLYILDIFPHSIGLPIISQLKQNNKSINLYDNIKLYIHNFKTLNPIHEDQYDRLFSINILNIKKFNITTIHITYPFIKRIYNTYEFEVTPMDNTLIPPFYAIFNNSTYIPNIYDIFTNYDRRSEYASTFLTATDETMIFNVITLTSISIMLLFGLIFVAMQYNDDKFLNWNIIVFRLFSGNLNKLFSGNLNKFKSRFKLNKFNFK